MRRRYAILLVCVPLVVPICVAFMMPSGVKSVGEINPGQDQEAMKMVRQWLSMEASQQRIRESTDYFAPGIEKEQGRPFLPTSDGEEPAIAGCIVLPDDLRATECSVRLRIGENARDRYMYLRVVLSGYRGSNSRPRKKHRKT